MFDGININIPLVVEEEVEEILMEVSESGEGGGEYPIYTGRTTVIPKTVEQALETAEKVVLSNINVLGIPYYETSNPSGITAIIGGNG